MPQYTQEEVIGKPQSPASAILVNLGLLLAMAATILAMPMFHSPVARWLMAGAAVAVLVGRFLSPYTGKVLRVKRLRRTELWVGAFFGVAAFFMFYQPQDARDWLAFTLAGGFLQAYTSLMLPRAMRQAMK
ncbi:MAG: YtxH domain-containing protein [Bacteroidales bacterium]|nr:YtxH domain-containing protein [Bacteroidales bacterium]